MSYSSILHLNKRPQLPFQRRLQSVVYFFCTTSAARNFIWIIWSTPSTNASLHQILIDIAAIKQKHSMLKKLVVTLTSRGIDLRIQLHVILVWGWIAVITRQNIRHSSIYQLKKMFRSSKSFWVLAFYRVILSLIFLPSFSSTIRWRATGGLGLTFVSHLQFWTQLS